MKVDQMGEIERSAFSPTIIPGIYSVRLSAPIAVQYELSAGCNQRCVFCYNTWKGKKEEKSALRTLSSEKRWEVIEKIITLDVFEVILSGGEPLLIPEICEMVYKLKKSNIRTYLITNGLLLTGKLAKKLKESGLDGIQISLHGSDAQINDAITGNSGSFDKTIRGFKNAVKFFNPESVNVNMVLLKDNYHDVASVMRLVDQIKGVYFSLGFLSKTGSALSADIEITKDEILEACRVMIQNGRKTGLDVGISGGFPFCLFPPEDREKIMHLSANICDAGLNQMIIAPNGDIRPCVCLPHILGNILNDDPKEVWKNSSFLRFLQHFEHVPPICHSCDLVAICKGGCRAAAYSVYGDFNSIDPIICDQMES